MKYLLTSLLFVLPGCGILDFGGDDKKAWEFRPGWQKGIQEIGPEDPTNPGFDKDGNLIPSKEVKATYQMPDVDAGMAYVFSEDNARLTPTVGIELCEFKTPYLRWFKVDLGAGQNYPYIYVGKRLTSIYEISVGVCYGYDLERTNDGDREGLKFAGMGTLIKF